MTDVFDVTQTIWDLDELGDEATIEDWSAAVRLADELDEPDRGQQLQVATELGGRLGFIPDGDVNAAIAVALAVPT